MIKSVLLIGLLMIICPILIGYGLLKFNKNNKSIFLAMILGFIFEFFIYEIISIPITALNLSVSTLKNVWIILISIFSILGLIFNILKIPEIFKENINKIKEAPKILTSVLVVLMLAQCYLAFTRGYFNSDETYLESRAKSACLTNEIMKYDDYGKEIENIPKEYIISNYSGYLAILSKACNLDVVVIMHTFMSVIYLIYGYMVYYLIVKNICKNNLNKTMLFMIIFIIVNLFAGYSELTNSYYRLYLGIWKGSSLLGNIMIPFIYYLFIEYFNDNNNLYKYIVLFITCTASIALTSASLIVIPLEVIILSVIFSIFNKDKSIVIKNFIVLIPNFILIVLYIILKGNIISNLSMYDLILKVKEYINESKPYLVIMLVSIIYLISKLDDLDNKKEVLNLIIIDIIASLIFICPLILKVTYGFFTDSNAEYYYILSWIVPMNLTITCFFVDLFEKLTENYEKVIATFLIIVLFGVSRRICLW